MESTKTNSILIIGNSPGTLQIIQCLENIYHVRHETNMTRAKIILNNDTPLDLILADMGLHENRLKELKHYLSQDEYTLSRCHGKGSGRNYFFGGSPQQSTLR